MYLGENEIKVLKQKVAQYYAIYLGYFLFKQIYLIFT